MEKTIHILNEMEQAGIISRYAIGGAVGAIFYMEPVVTYDLDVFVELPASGGLVTLTPIYEYLRGRGYREDKECVIIEGFPVQFLPVFNPLLQEALKEARETMYGQEKTRTFRPEHLAAIMLQTGRPKDMGRLATFVEEAGMDDDYLIRVLGRHGLSAAWRKFRGDA